MNKGFAFCAFEKLNNDIVSAFKPLMNFCDEIVVGIPDKWAYSRLFGSEIGYDIEKTVQTIKQIDGVKDVLVFEPGEISIESAHERVGFDTYFYGTECGKEFSGLTEYADKYDITLISSIELFKVNYINGDALSLALNNVKPWDDIVLYGSAKYIELYMENYAKSYKPMYVICNDLENLTIPKESINLVPFELLREKDVNSLFVVLCDEKYEEQKKHIFSIGEFEYRPMNYNNSIALMEELGISFADECEYVEESQSALLQIFKDFDEICRSENIKYYMICGSLIGAVRDHGFIPWDDDLDIAIRREDYNKFKNAYNERWGDGKKYDLQDIGDWKYDFFLDCSYRMVDITKLYPNKVNTNVCSSKNADIFRHKVIDIYVIDSAFDNKVLHSLQMNTLKVLYNMAMGHRNKMDYSQYERLGKPIVSVMKLLNVLGKVFPLKYLLKKYEDICQWANGKDTEYYFMSGFSITCIERKLRKDFFGDGQDVPFEDTLAMIPSNVEGLMEAMHYCDYLSYPSYDIRKPSHYFNSGIEIW